ncbi:MAG: TetR/AcrR family transcriptional regulator [Rhodocyclaceae bacterium]|jgi:AcrR family transcriptional regulator|nr:TetR/AcrR family transcriptional regulator [Azospira sp.]HNN45399.1 TetR/AcrR family transcriptional regulator [Azospira sp.]
MDKKPKRRTRERILETSLRLFNDFGEPNVTTTVIADEMNISPGNLYYHFHSKDEIVNALFSDFERDIDKLFSAVGRRAASVEDIWLFVHLLFEIIWRNRYLYRDLPDLLTRNRLLEVHLGRILESKVRAATQACEGLVEAGEMQASASEIAALANNMAALATCWLSFEYARNPRRQVEGDALGRGVYQVMAMLAPFLVGDARLLLQRLSAEYLK